MKVFGRESSSALRGNFMVPRCELVLWVQGTGLAGVTNQATDISKSRKEARSE